MPLPINCDWNTTFAIFILFPLNALSLFALLLPAIFFSFFLFNSTASTEIYTLSLHDALPIYRVPAARDLPRRAPVPRGGTGERPGRGSPQGACGCRQLRSEEHTSELQSRRDLVCRLLLEKKNLPVCHSPLIATGTRLLQFSFYFH